MKIKFIEKIKENDFWRSVSVLVSGTILAKIIGLITFPIISRLYAPKDFGENAVIIATASIILSLGALGLNSAVMLPKNDKESSIVLKVTFFSSLIIYSIIFFLIIVFSRYLQIVQISIPYLLASSFIFLIAVSRQLEELLKIYINRKGMNRVLFNNSIIHSLATLIVTVPLGFLKFGVIGLLSASILSALLSVVQMMCFANPFKQKIVWKDFIAVYNEYKKFIFYQYPAKLIGTFAIQYPTRFFSSNYGNIKLGSYNMSERILGIPMQLLAAPITNVYFRTASKYQEKTNSLADFTFKIIISIMLFAIIPILVLALWGEELFSLILGSQWVGAGKIASVLVIQYVYNFSTNSISYCRVVLNRQKLNLLIVIIRLLIVVSSLYWGMIIYKNLFNVIIIYSVGMTGFYILDMTFNFIALKKYVLKYLIFSTVYALLAFALIFLLN